jgi:1-acylglycerone phosphate reductase
MFSSTARRCKMHAFFQGPMLSILRFTNTMHNISGIAYTMPAIDTDVAAVQRMFDINLFGPMRMVCHFHDMLIRSKGTIVNIGSIGGIIPFLYGCESSSISTSCLVYFDSLLAHQY